MAPHMRGKIIRWLLDRLMASKGIDVPDQKVEVHSVWMIEVLSYSLIKRQMTAVFVVGILRQQNRLVAAKRLRESFSYCRFSRTGAATNA